MFNPIAQIKIHGLEEMRFELYRDTYDSTGNFIELAQNGFYDGLELFNFEKDRFIQTGCSNNDGSSVLQYSIRGAFSRNGFINNHKHQFGSLGYARTLHRDSAGSQIYFSLGENKELDGTFAVFRNIIYGEEQLELLNQETEQRWIIESITINDRGEEVPKSIKIYKN